MTPFEIVVCLVLGALAIGKGVTVARITTLQHELTDARLMMEELILRDNARRDAVEQDAVAKNDAISKTMWASEQLRKYRAAKGRSA